MDSSESDFAWTTTSSSSEDSDEKVIETMNDHSNEGKKYKKKLQKELRLHNDNESETEIKSKLLLNNYSDTEESIKKEEKEKKQTRNDSEIECYGEKRHKKKKGKRKEIINDRKDSIISTDHETSFRENTLRDDQSDNETDINGKLSFRENNLRENQSDSETDIKAKLLLSHQDLSDHESHAEIKKREKKSKRKRKETESQDEHSTKRKEGHDKESFVEDSDAIVEKSRKSSVISTDDSFRQSGDADRRMKKISTQTDSESIESEQLNRTKASEKQKKSVMNGDVTAKRFSISERLVFEEEMEIDDHVSNAVNAIEEPKHVGDPVDLRKVHRFLKSNPHLKPITVTQNLASVISVDDDIWVLNCPHEVDINLLENSDINIEEKCKMKVDSHTYNGTLNTDYKNVALLTFQSNKPIIKNLPVHGIVNFRKKIPRPHFIEYNEIVNEQTNFIPLPDTKCRHPLFGSDYKKAIKIPSAVKARLNAVPSDDVDAEVVHGKKKKKKHKKDRIEFEETVEVKTEEPRKKRKHAHADEEEPVTKKSKKSKHNPDTVWDSEKAIEESLFNF